MHACILILIFFFTHVYKGLHICSLSRFPRVSSAQGTYNKNSLSTKNRQGASIKRLENVVRGTNIRDQRGCRGSYKRILRHTKICAWICERGFVHEEVRGAYSVGFKGIKLTWQRRPLSSCPSLCAVSTESFCSGTCVQSHLHVKPFAWNQIDVAEKAVEQLSKLVCCLHWVILCCHVCNVICVYIPKSFVCAL